MHKHGLPNPVMQDRSFLVNVFDKLVVNMALCSEVEEETDEENGRQKNSSGETDKTVAALEAMPMRLNCG